MKRYYLFIALLLFGLLFVPTPVSAYLTGPSPTLDQIAAQSDLIVKARVVSSHPAQDAWLGTMPGAVVEETRLQVLSVLKGSSSCNVIAFRHYEVAQTGPWLSDGPGPLYYQLTPSRTYLVFAKTAEGSCAFRQLWKVAPGFKGDQGVVLCADATPITAQDVRTAVWHELTGLLLNPDSQDELYALHHLDSLSGRSEWLMSPREFDLGSVLAAVAPLLRSSDPEVTKLAVSVVTGSSAYFDDEMGTHWTPRRGAARLPDVQIGSPLPQVTAARPYLPQLLSLASDSPDLSVRTLAMRSLGSIHDPNLEESELRWAGEAQPQVRTAAALLLAGDPAPTAQIILGKLSRDAVPSVRTAVARGIELTQNTDGLPLLTSLLHDTDLGVREAAASSLAALPVAQTRDVLRANLDDPDFKPMFLDNLAEDDPTPYLDGLAQVVEERLTPPSFGGYLPDAEARKILFNLLSSQSGASLTSKKWRHYMDVLDGARVWSGSEPRDLYAFYVSHHLTERAFQFRQSSKIAIPFDMESLYDDVDREAATTAKRP